MAITIQEKDHSMTLASMRQMMELGVVFDLDGMKAEKLYNHFVASPEFAELSKSISESP